MRFLIFALLLAMASGASGQIPPIRVTPRPIAVPTEVRPVAPVTVRPVAIANRLDTLDVWRTQLYVHTCDLEGAGSDEDVWVQLTDNPADRFWLDRGEDDRKRNRDDLWDVLAAKTKMSIKGRDITRIEFGTTGDDGWCFDRVDLLLNFPDPDFLDGRTRRWRVFRAELEPTWIKGGASRYPSQTTVADRGALYLSETWNSESPRLLFALPSSRQRPAPFGIGIERDVLASIIEGIVGDLLGPSEEAAILGWGNKSGAGYVDFIYRDPTRITVDLDLGTERGIGSRVSDVDVTFDLVAGCASGVVRLDVVNFSTELSTLGRAVHSAAAGLTEGIMQRFNPDDRSGVVAFLAPCSSRFGFTEEGHLSIL